MFSGDSILLYCTKRSANSLFLIFSNCTELMGQIKTICPILPHKVSDSAFCPKTKKDYNIVVVYVYVWRARQDSNLWPSDS
jgi:hypothetical protein